MMRHAGLRTKDIRNVFVTQSGGPASVGFQGKDLYNYSYIASVGFQGKDLCCAIFAPKEATIQPFFTNIPLKKNEKLGNLFWSDSISRFDLMCFGDVIAFDVAFKRNRYDRPIVIIIGVNHHHQSIILACGILVNENAENYRWLLRMLLKCSGAMPIKSVVTDGAASMRRAIRNVLPDATHRLCSWHIQRNAMTHTKDAKFVKAFSALMYKPVNETQFNMDWENLIQEYEVTNLPWVKEMWECRGMWAEAHLKTKFFGGTRTTSRCESMHSCFDKLVGRRLAFSDFVRRFDLVLATIRHKEIELDHKSEYTFPEMRTGLKEYEFQAGKIYTAESFDYFMTELIEVGAYNDFAQPVHEEGKTLYFVCRFNSDKSSRMVAYVHASGIFHCDCDKFASTGFPCRPVLYVLKRENFSSMPTSLLLTRWTNDAKKIFPYPTDKVDKTVMEAIRYGDFCGLMRELGSLACKTVETHNRAKDEVLKTIAAIRKMLQGECEPRERQEWEGLGDPDIPTKRKKGANKVSGDRRCSLCKQIGHTKPKCPNNKKKRQW